MKTDPVYCVVLHVMKESYIFHIGAGKELDPVYIGFKNSFISLQLPMTITS